MGEIGRDRKEFLYEMSYCDIMLITRGYRRRNVLQYQLQRLTAYGTFHAMRGDKQQKGPDGWMPMYFDRYITDDSEPISKAEVDEMLDELAAINAAMSDGQ